MPDVSKVIYDTSGEIIDGPVYSVNGERREVNKVVYGVTTLIDITDSTVTSNNLLRGQVAYGADGSRVVGNIDQTIEHLEVGGTVSLDENDYMEFDDSGGGSEINLQAKTNISPTTSSQTIIPDSGYDGLSSVQINSIPSQYIVPAGSQTVQNNGTYDVTNLAEMVVNVSGGGSSIESGTFTPETNSKTFTLTVPSGITNFVFYATDFDVGIAGAGWNTVGGIWFNGIGKTFIRYNNNNNNVSSLTVTINDTLLTLTAQYNLRTEKTYKWYAW